MPDNEELDWETALSIGRDHESVAHLVVDESLGYTSQILVARKQIEAAQAMEKIIRWEREATQDGWNGAERAYLFLEYEPGDRELFEDNFDREIGDVWHEVTRRRNYPSNILSSLGFREVFPSITYGWREQLAEILHGERRSNHAIRVRQEDPRWTEDNLYFTNAGELRFYRRLKYWQEQKFPKADTFSISPLAATRIRGRTFEPDFLITFRKRTGVIEVDGPHHNKRYAHDSSRDDLLRDAGVAELVRIPVAALDSVSQTDGYIERFLRRLKDA